MFSHWSPSKWLLQSAPPDMAEPGKERWTFGLYEILDQRDSPVDPRVVHTTYRGVIELAEDEIPDPADKMFTARLEEVVVNKWKKLSGL